MISEAQQEQAALYALDSLSAEEAAAFEREMAASAELRLLVRELRETGAALAHLAEPRTAPADLKMRVMKRIAAEARSHDAAAANVIHPAPSVFGRWVPWAIAAALVVACVMLVRDRAELQRELTAEQRATQTERARATQAEQAAEAARADAARIAATAQQMIAAAQAKPLLVPLGATKDGPPKAQAVVAWDPARQAGTIRIDNLPAAGSERDYQLWAVDAQHKDPISAGVVRVNADGSTVVEFKPTAPANAVQAFAISVERKGGVPKREGPIILLGSA